MKMSEHFPEAFQVEHNKSFEVQDATWYSYGEKYEYDGDQDSAIEHAVLNHDRMADEIAELKVINGGIKSKSLHRKMHIELLNDEIAELRDSESKLVNETEDLKCEIEDLRKALSVLSDADNHSVSQVRMAMRKSRELLNK